MWKLNVVQKYEDWPHDVHEMSSADFVANIATIAAQRHSREMVSLYVTHYVIHSQIHIDGPRAAICVCFDDCVCSCCRLFHSHFLGRIFRVDAIKSTILAIDSLAVK